MEHLSKVLLIACILFTTSLQVSAANSGIPPDSSFTQIHLEASVGFFGESLETFSETLPEEKVEEPVIYRKVAVVPPFFEGFLIEVAYSEKKLRPNHHILHRYGDLMIDGNIQNGYSYLIPGLRSKDGTIRFYKNIIKPQQPNARVVRYKKKDRKYLSVKE